MNRRDFLVTSGLVAALAPTLGLAADSAPAGTGISVADHPVLLPALPPLDHKGNMDIRVRVRSSMTRGVFSSVECAVAPKRMGPAPHAHKELDELMYVVAGTASVLVGDEVVQVAAGGWHLRPHGIKHTFWNAAEEPLRFFDVYFNQPFEEYLEKTFHEFTPENGYPENSEKRRRAVSELSAQFGVYRFPDSQSQRQSIMKEYGLI